jgi:ketosteroid isomerase-like protein
MRAAAAALALLACLTSPAAAQSTARPSAEADIRAAFAQWTDDFNARRADRVCDLFARNLISNYRGTPERGYARQCQILNEALTGSERRYHYALTIKEILVFGEIAIARIVWTLTIRETATGKETTVIEPGLDVFRKDADGKWRIFRYIAYDEG